MYQAIVLGLGFLLLFGSGYLIKSMDDTGIISSELNLATSTEASATSTPEVSLEGVYLCDTDTGCKSPSTLTISGEGEARMITSYDNGVEVLQESGTWKTSKDGRVTIYITGTDSTVYPSPHVLSIKYASPSSLSGIMFDANAYKEWTIPVFRKQSNDIE
jgi:hypothetical protein